MPIHLYIYLWNCGVVVSRLIEYGHIRAVGNVIQTEVGISTKGCKRICQLTAQCVGVTIEMTGCRCEVLSNVTAENNVTGWTYFSESVCFH